jgi:2'-5' RNA ligase
MTSRRTGALLSDEVVVGVVIKVPEPWGEDLTQWRIGFGDPHAEKILAHITLLPPLRMSREKFQNFPTRLESELGGLRAFEMSLGPIGSFRPVSPVVYLEAHAEGSTLQTVHQAVWHAADCPPQRHPFVPHCTVAMDVPDSVLDAASSALENYAARWTVPEIAILTRDAQGFWSPGPQIPFMGR